MDEMFEDDGSFTINYSLLIESEDHLDITKNLARKLMKETYITVGEFLDSLHEDEISELLEISEHFKSNDDEEDDDDDSIEDNHLGDLILISEMLATAEGLDSADSTESVHHRISQLVAFLAVESLARKGLVISHKQNMSFGEDMAKKIIAERIKDD